MRDNLCKLENLKKIISFNEGYILKDEEMIVSLQKDIREGIQRFPKKNEDIICSKRLGILRQINEVIRAKFSLGSECADLHDTYLKGISTIRQMDDHEMGFVNFIQFFSLGILLEAGTEMLTVLVKYADSQKLDGKLIDYLAHACGLDRNYHSSGFGKNKPYIVLEKIIKTAFEDKESASAELEKYMKRSWLQGHRDYDWHTAHKRPGYVGLWSFETAALAKILKLDDSKLKDDNHYPYDLAHYKNDMDFKVESPLKIQSAVKLEEQFKQNGIVINPEIEGVIPCQFHQFINQLITDYERLTDINFWEKYDLGNIWFSVEEYSAEKKQGMLLGTIIVNKLVEKGYILQLDYKDKLDDYRDNIKNIWGNKEIKLIGFELENDQVYYTCVPKETSVKALFEVVIYNV